MIQLNPIVSAVIVSYDTRELTIQCVDTFCRTLGDMSAEVMVVDNASTDGTVAAIRAGFPEVQVFAQPRNIGFGAANNVALQKARGEFFLLLNSDAFPEPDAVQRLVDYLRRHPGAGVVGPRLLNRDGSLQPSCYRFPSPGRAWLENLWVASLLPPGSPWGDFRRWGHDEERDVDWVSGACLLIRREAYAAVGAFDERFFMYQEETDWQRRLRDRGWRVGFTPAARVMHFGGASGAADQVRINRHFFESLDRYEWKHHGLAGLVSVRLAMIVGCFLRTLLWTTVLLVPKRRKRARSKAKLSAWLFVRQATYWQADFKQGDFKQADFKQADSEGNTLR